MSIWDVESGRVVATRPNPGGGDLRTAFSADGSALYVDDGSGWLTTLDGTSLRPAGAPVGFVPDATSLLPDPRGGSIVVLEAGGSVARFDLATGAVGASTVVPRGDEDPVGVLAPDGSVLAVSDGEGAVRLLDARTLGEVRRTATEAGDALAYAPDGSQLASVQPDRIKLWNGRTGAYEASIPLPNLPATGLWSTATLGPGATIAYLPDSSGVVVASADGRIWSVDTRTDSWLDRACRIAGRNLTAAELRQFLPRQRSGPGCPQWPVGG
jgi:WD40 repeat protein